MCGIAGAVSFEDDLRENGPVFDRMLLSMARRGPDQEGSYFSSQAVLLHRRLAVIDLEGGRQPMSFSQDGRSFHLVYNGELYNTEELRRELLALGQAFESRSDTEVLLKAYLQWGDSCVERLNGIFAFAVWQPEQRRLFLARDRMGVKPLFFARRGGLLLFASELKTLLCHPQVQPELDLQGVRELMLLGPGRTPGCGVFRGVEELLPGQSAVFSPEGLHISRYWDLHDREHREDLKETAEHVRFLVTDAIQRQLVSDVPVATFLSGGLDSSIISAVADLEFARRGVPLTTVSVDYRDNDKYFKASKFQPNSDGEYIQIMDRGLKAEHRWVTLDTPALTDALSDAVEARDLPGMADVDSSLLLFCREVRRSATMALSGECADEIFGGYPWFRDPEIRNQEGFPWAQSTQWRAGLLRPEFLAGFDAREFVQEKYRSAVAQADVLPGTSPLERRMKEMTRLNLDWFMQTLLDRKDRMSMYNGLEVRVPFCDYRIVEYLYGVPWEMKEYRGVEKGLLRLAMEGLLPQEVLWRKKSPYPKTHNPSYLAEVSRRLQNVLADPASPVLQLVRRESLEGLLSEAHPWPWYGQLMAAPQTIAWFLQLDHWMRHYQVRLV